MDKKRLIIIDGHSLAHRAFHALPPFTTKNGEQTGAVYGFLLAFFKTIKEFNPDFIVAAFDFPGATFRHEELKTYKAKRPKMPDELSSQITKIKKILRSFKVPIFEKEKFEADDLIGTIAKEALRKQIIPKIEIIILSGDCDLLQLVNANTRVYLLKRGVKNTVLCGIEEVKDKYDGLAPDRLLDYKGLRGDPSDNIPGVSGIGEKTAIELIKKFTSLENLYKDLEENTDEVGEIKSRIRDKLLNHKEDAFLSKKLSEINCNVSIDFILENCYFSGFKKKEIEEVFKEWGFTSLLNKIPKPKSLDKE